MTTADYMTAYRDVLSDMIANGTAEWDDDILTPESRMVAEDAVRSHRLYSIDGPEASEALNNDLMWNFDTMQGKAERDLRATLAVPA